VKTKDIALLAALAAQITAGIAHADIVNESGSVNVYADAYAYNSNNTVGPVTQSLPSGNGSFVGGPVYNQAYYNDPYGTFTLSGNSGATAGGTLSSGSQAISGSAGAVSVSSGYQLGGSGAVSPSAASSTATVSGSYYNSTPTYWYVSTMGQGNIVADGNASGSVDVNGTIVGPNQSASGEFASGGFFIEDVVNASAGTPGGTGANTASTGQYDLSFALSLSSAPISIGAAPPAYITLPTLSPVPLPSTAWLLIGGLGGLGALARKKRAA
jgi:hypothetical protein